MCAYLFDMFFFVARRRRHFCVAFISKFSPFFLFFDSIHFLYEILAFVMRLLLYLSSSSSFDNIGQKLRQPTQNFQKTKCNEFFCVRLLLLLLLPTQTPIDFSFGCHYCYCYYYLVTYCVGKFTFQ